MSATSAATPVAAALASAAPALAAAAFALAATALALAAARPVRHLGLRSVRWPAVLLRCAVSGDEHRPL